MRVRDTLALPSLEHLQLRKRMNIELNFPPNLEGLVLGCIDADFCKEILVGISYLFEKKIEKKDMGRD